MISHTDNQPPAGHAAHTKVADSQESLRGRMLRPIVVTFLGAGSGFCPTLCRDVLLIRGADHGEFRLVDIDEERLATMLQVVQRLIQATGRKDGWTVRASTHRRDLLPGTDYAVCCVEVLGTACVQWDNDIPLKYGLDQCIGDTMGPGGLFKGLRTIPVFLEILRDLRELAPQAMMLNYTNPMSMLVLAAARAVPEVPVIGLCHSIQNTSHQLADYAGVPYDEMEWECAGINHLAWFTTLKHQGRDLYQSVLFPKFAAEVEEGFREAETGLATYQTEQKYDWGNPMAHARYKMTDLVRKDMCLHFGAFMTESSGHLSEYLPYYRKNDQGRQLLRLGYDGESRFLAHNWPDWRRSGDAQRARWLSGEEKVELKRSWEYASWIIEAREKDAPFRIHANVMNQACEGGAGRLITNLPETGTAEVACLVDRNGVHPTRYGALPPQMAAICNANMSFIDLAATACIDKSKDAAVLALLLDPLTQAVLSPREIKAMTLELFAAEAAYLPGFH